MRRVLSFYEQNLSFRKEVKEIGKLAGKEVSKEKEDKIVNTILKDKVPKNIDKII